MVPRGDLVKRRQVKFMARIDVPLPTWVAIDTGPHLGEPGLEATIQIVFQHKCRETMGHVVCNQSICGELMSDVEEINGAALSPILRCRWPFGSQNKQACRSRCIKFRLRTSIRTLTTARGDRRGRSRKDRCRYSCRYTHA